MLQIGRLTGLHYYHGCAYLTSSFLLAVSCDSVSICIPTPPKLDQIKTKKIEYMVHMISKITQVH
jgi:hypothetical protein